MYRVYIENILLPIAPESIKISSKNQNSTVSLVSEEEFNVLKLVGLTTYEFSFVLPNVQYHFSVYENDVFQSPSYFKEKLLSIKENKRIVDFTVITDDENTDFSNKIVTIEQLNFTYQGTGEVAVYITLKDYVNHETKLVSVVEKSPTTSETRPLSTQETATTYTIVSGDTLTAIAKRFYNNTAYAMEIYYLNKTLLDEVALSRGYPSESGHWWIFPGTVIELP